MISRGKDAEHRWRLHVDLFYDKCPLLFWHIFPAWFSWDGQSYIQLSHGNIDISTSSETPDLK